MKNLLYTFLALFISVNAFCGGGPSGITMPIASAWNGTNPIVGCASGYARGALTSVVYGPLVLATCPNEASCTNGAFAGAYEALTLKNTTSAPACFKVDYQTAFANSVSFTVVGSYTTNENCAAVNAPGRGFADNGTYFVNQPAVDNYEIEVPACTEFTVVTWGFSGASGAYSVSITSKSGKAADLGCAGAECIKTLTIGGTQVPTMTQWGLFLFGLIVLTLGVVAVFNMSRKSSNETAR